MHGFSLHLCAAEAIGDKFKCQVPVKQTTSDQGRIEKADFNCPGFLAWQGRAQLVGLFFKVTKPLEMLKGKDLLNNASPLLSLLCRIQ